MRIGPGKSAAADKTRSPWLVLTPATFVVLWSTGFIGAKFGLPHAEPFTFLLIRFVCVSVILAAAAVLVGAPWPRDPRQIGRTVVAGLIVGLQPLLTAVVAPFYLDERIVPRQWLGLGLGFAGVVLVVVDKLSLGAGHLAGGGWALAALLGITAGTLYQKRHASGMHLCTGSAVQFAACAVVYLPVALLLETMRVDWTAEFVFALAWLTVVLSIGAISLLHLLIRWGAAARIASLFYLTPAVTAAFAWVLFGETLGVPAIAGMVLAAAGVALVTRP
jgi:drug/metabolite transporter (DMT)-like permease